MANQHAEFSEGEETVSRREAGVVIPHTATWMQRLSAGLIYRLIRLLTATIRFGFEVSGATGECIERGPVIFATWHNRLLLSLIIYEILAQSRHRERRLAAMVSASRDGGVLARVLELFGVQPVRGSTSRRGPQALRELVTAARRGLDLAITPDGPRGPCYRVQSGVIALGQLTGLAIVPVTYQLGRKVRLRSWDGFQVPWPFTECMVTIGPPLRIAESASEEDREKARAELEQWLSGATKD